MENCNLNQKLDLNLDCYKIQIAFLSVQRHFRKKSVRETFFRIDHTRILRPVGEVLSMCSLK